MKVLLIEDDAIDAEIVQNSLDSAGEFGFELVHVLRMSEAAERLRAESFDLVLLDLSLPDGDGLTLVERIQSIEKAVPIVILTGREGKGIAVEAMQRGVQDYLSKGDLNPENLARAMRYAVERQRLLGKLDAARQKVVEGERHKVLAETARAAAHEIHNPLAVICGYVELMRSDLPDDFSHREHLEEIYQAARDISDIVKHMAAARRYTVKTHGSQTDPIVDFDAAIT